MNPQSWIWDVISWAALPLIAAILIVFLYRRRVSEYPLFFAYLVAAEVVGIVRYAGSSAPAHTYYYIYYISDIVYTLFALMAIYELFIKRLFPAFYKVRFYRYIFLLAALLITGMAIAIGLISGHARVLSLTVHIYNFVRAAITIFFVALMLAMGRRWNRQEFGIAFGLALDVSISLAALGVWSHTPGQTVLIEHVSVVVYDVACLIWLYCFWSAPKVTASPTALSPEALLEARKWQESLKDFMSHTKR